MRFKDRFVRRYVSCAPLALALERAYECHILSQQKFEPPVLDIGCGDGIFAAVLFDEKISVGVDPDGDELERARQSGMYHELILTGAQRIPKADKTFKTIFANSVLEHILPIKEVLREARRVLDDEGRMYLTLPTNRFDHYTIVYQALSLVRLNSIAEEYRRFFNRFWKHYHYYDAKVWQQLFEECGWTVASVREYNPQRTCLLHDSLVPVSIISFVSRKLLGRWFIIPILRQLYAPLLSLVFSPIVAKNVEAKDNGGLIFFELRKKK